MGPGEIENRSNGDKPGGVYLRMSEVIMSLYVFKVHRRRDSGLLVEIGEVPLEVRVLQDSAKAALKMNVVDDVKANQSAEKPPVALHDARAKQISFVR